MTPSSTHAHHSSFSPTRRQLLGYGSAIATLQATPAPLLARQSETSPVAADDWQAIDDQLTPLAPSTALLAAELVDGEIVQIHGIRQDDVLPIASSFKLWILGTLAQQVENGTLDWEQLVEIDDAYRSVPGGDLRYAPTGTTFTMRYLAERMIQKSDNTATDHMLHLAGRENVEQMLAAMGHHDPSLNIPLLSTRELTMLKFAYPADQLETYLAASVDEKRRILAEEIDAIPYEALADIDQTAPMEINRIEWFATRNDLAHTMAWLHAASQRPGLRPVAEILSLETPIPFDGET